MKTLHFVTAVACVTILAGCETATKSNPAVVRYHPKDGEHMTVYVDLFSKADFGPKPSFIGAPAIVYNSSFVGTDAKVVVEVNIDADGNVTNVRVIGATPEFVGAPVAAGFLRAKFQPAQKDRISVPCVIRVTEQFRL